jgi:methylase of polypeptide subunit release factors
MGFIERPLSGEWEGTLDVRDYGIETIPVDPITPEERDLGIAELYRAARFRTGVSNARLEPFLELQPYDPEPARRLVDKHEALEYPYECAFGAAQLAIDRGVFCPTLTNVSPFLLKQVDFRSGEKVLDAFTGSGAFAVNAALHGAQAVAYDISPQAVACTQKNAAKNNVGTAVDARLGTLHEAVAADEQFDLVIANPPLIPGDPENPLEAALFDSGLQATQEFVAALPAMLAKGGRCYLSTSDVIDRKDYKVDIARLCGDSGLVMDTVATMHFPYESYRVHKIERPGLATWIRPLVRKTVAYLAEH